MKTPFDIEEKTALDLDRRDTLKPFRERFYIPESTIYMDGNSLGLLSIDAEDSLKHTFESWKTKGIYGWFDKANPWLGFAEELGALTAPIVGADAEEVVATATTTVNIHSLLSTFYQPQENKTKILADELTFPTDLYALQSHLDLRGYSYTKHLSLVKSNDGNTLDERDIITSMTDDVALIFLPSVLYRSGQLLDMRRLSEAAHERNILIGFDCSHSVGVISHNLDEWDVDFAVWCSYKYLNGGPGAPAFIYINRKHFDKKPGMAGWFGFTKDKQFDMLLEFEHQRSAGGWQISSPGILGAAPLIGSLNVIREAGIEAIREKSLVLTSYLIHLIDGLLTDEPYEFSIATPREQERRGGHIALKRKEYAEQICKTLEAEGIVPDFRPPNIIRIAPVALYNTFHEVWQVVQKIKYIIDTEKYLP